MITQFDLIPKSSSLGSKYNFSSTILVALSAMPAMSRKYFIIFCSILERESGASFPVNPLVPEGRNIYRIAKISFKKRRNQGKKFLLAPRL